MTSLTSQDGKLVVRDGKLGTEQACCCGEGDGTGAQCSGSCGWVNYQPTPGQPQDSGGWYFLFDSCIEEGCGCPDPLELCGEAPPGGTEEIYEECNSNCQADNPIP